VRSARGPVGIGTSLRSGVVGIGWARGTKTGASGASADGAGGAVELDVAVVALGHVGGAGRGASFALPFAASLFLSLFFSAAGLVQSLCSIAAAISSTNASVSAFVSPG
jgi:hypothetical protein